MYSYSYTVENSNLYLNFPISFTSNYFTEILDAGVTCASYGAKQISTNKIQVFNIGWNPDGNTQLRNYTGYTGF